MNINKSVITKILLVSVLFSVGLQKPTYAAKKGNLNSEVQLNKKFKPANSKVEAAEEYANTVHVKWQAAKKNPSFEKWEEVTYFCKKASEAYLAINDIEKVNRLKANEAKALARSHWELARVYSTAENWLNCAHLFLEAQNACKVANDTKGIELCDIFYKLANANSDIANANIACQNSTIDPSFFYYVNAEALCEKAAQSCLSAKGKKTHAIYLANAAEAQAFASLKVAELNPTVDNWLKAADLFTQIAQSKGSNKYKKYADDIRKYALSLKK